MFQQIEQLIGAFESGRLSRRQLAARLSALIAALAGAERVAAAEDVKTSTFEALGLNHIALRVTNVSPRVGPS